MIYYCFDGDDLFNRDPHARVIDVDAQDNERIREQRAHERATGIDKDATGSWVLVKDRNTMQRVEIASAPCGHGCHCAAVARDPRAWVPDDLTVEQELQNSQEDEAERLRHNYLARKPVDQPDQSPLAGLGAVFGMTEYEVRERLAFVKARRVGRGFVE